MLVFVEGQQIFRTIGDIKQFFSVEKYAAEFKQVEGKADSYFFVLASPYDIVATDVYCFVKRHSNWHMFIKAHLFDTPGFDEKVKFQVDGDFVDVVCKGVVIIKLNAPKW